MKRIRRSRLRRKKKTIKPGMKEKSTATNTAGRPEGFMDDVNRDSISDTDPSHFGGMGWPQIEKGRGGGENWRKQRQMLLSKRLIVGKVSRLDLDKQETCLGLGLLEKLTPL